MCSSILVPCSEGQSTAGLCLGQRLSEVAHVLQQEPEGNPRRVHLGVRHGATTGHGRVDASQHGGELAQAGLPGARGARHTRGHGGVTTLPRGNCASTPSTFPSLAQATGTPPPICATTPSTSPSLAQSTGTPPRPAPPPPRPSSTHPHGRGKTGREQVPAPYLQLGMRRHGVELVWGYLLGRVLCNCLAVQRPHGGQKLPHGHRVPAPATQHQAQSQQGKGRDSNTGATQPSSTRHKHNRGREGTPARVPHTEQPKHHGRARGATGRSEKETLEG